MKTCQHCHKKFEFSPYDHAVFQKMQVPEPGLCPRCRRQRRLSFRNDSNYYRNTCHLCQKSVISIYSPDKSIPVLCNDCFWSDQFDPLDYGEDYDFGKPFFEQYAQMRKKVPRIAIYNTQSENSEFTVHSSKNRNCYMSSSLVDCQDVLYSDFTINSRDSMDMLFSTNMEQCYGCSDSQDCTLSAHLELCSNLSESFLAFDCRSGKNLVGCVSLRGKQNYILNEPALENEVKETIKKLKTNSTFFRTFKEKYEALKISLPKRYAWMTNAENSSGDYLVNCKNAQQCYRSTNLEDCRYVYEVISATDAYDCDRNGNIEMTHECQGNVDLALSQSCNLTYQSDNMKYCDNCQASSYCFGGMSLKRHKYVILNKQYTKESYEAIVPKIIDHMKAGGEYGEFFPIELSAFGYNETKAQEFFPLTKVEAVSRGWPWSDYEAPLPDNLKTIPAQKLPDNIKDIPNDILNWAIIAEETEKPFRLVKQEFEFYRNQGLPVPRFTPKARHQKRVALQNTPDLYERNCDKCQIAFQSTYSSDRPEIVYCETCYLKEVY